jgi:hypothetical protein
MCRARSTSVGPSHQRAQPEGGSQRRFARGHPMLHAPERPTSQPCAAGRCPRCARQFPLRPPRNRPAALSFGAAAATRTKWAFSGLMRNFRVYSARHDTRFNSHNFGTRSRMIVDEQDRTILRNRDLLASATNWTSDPPRFVHLVGAAGMSDTGTLRAFVFGGSPLDAPFARIDHGPQSRLSAGTGWCAYLSGLPARREVLVPSPSTTGI